MSQGSLQNAAGQGEVRFFWISSRLSDQVGAETTEAGKMLPLDPSGGLRLFPTRPRGFEGVGCPVGVDVTIAGGGDGLFFFLFFLNHLL